MFVREQCQKHQQPETICIYIYSLRVMCAPQTPMKYANNVQSEHSIRTRLNAKWPLAVGRPPPRPLIQTSPNNPRYSLKNARILGVCSCGNPYIGCAGLTFRVSGASPTKCFLLFGGKGATIHTATKQKKTRE